MKKSELKELIKEVLKEVYSGQTDYMEEKDWFSGYLKAHKEKTGSTDEIPMTFDKSTEPKSEPTKIEKKPSHGSSIYTQPDSREHDELDEKLEKYLNK